MGCIRPCRKRVVIFSMINVHHITRTLGERCQVFAWNKKGKQACWLHHAIPRSTFHWLLGWKILGPWWSWITTEPWLRGTCPKRFSSAKVLKMICRCTVRPRISWNCGVKGVASHASWCQPTVYSATRRCVLCWNGSVAMPVTHTHWGCSSQGRQ